MLRNNWQRMNIWLKLKDKFNYEEFKTACLEAGCEPMPIVDFAQKSGIMIMALNANIEMPPAEAYITFMTTNQEAYTPTNQIFTSSSADAPKDAQVQEVIPKPGCVTCGGSVTNGGHIL